MAGCILGLVNHLLLHNASDYDAYNDLGVAEWHMLFNDPQRFFTDIFHSNYSEYGDFFGSSGSYWNDLRTNIIFKILGLMNIFSRGNYYINSLFFNFICFFGHVALYRVYINVYSKQKLPVIIGCFLLPSLLYFSSGVHKDLIVFTALAFFCYCMYFLFDCGFSRKRIFFLLLSFLVILAIRNFVAVILFPFAIVWFISKKYRRDPYKVFTATIGILFALVLTLHFSSTTFDPLRVIVSKQQSFFALGGSATQYHNDTLSGKLQSFAVAAPSALRHSFLSPLPGEFHAVYTYLFSFELICYLLLLILLLKYPLKNQGNSPEFLLFSLTFCFFIFLLAGYITPAAGALVRYRSVYLPFL